MKRVLERKLLIAFIVFVFFSFSYPTMMVFAAIVKSGDVSPVNPASWTSDTTGYIGLTTVGTVIVNSGSQLKSNSSYVGEGTDSNGTATITGIGSKWIDSGSLYIGNYGKGTLKIEAGGEVSDSYGCIGYYAGSVGSVVVTGSGSKWTNANSLYVGMFGSGNLTVTDGGTVNVNGGLYASLKDFYGNGTITAHGGVIDADLNFDAAHGLQQTIAFGTTGTINFTQDGKNQLGVGYKDKGTLRIVEGTTISCSGSTLGYYSGAVGTATVSGTGSKWINNGSIYIGNFGTGVLRIESGGEVNNSSCFLGNSAGSDGSVIVTGSGSKWVNTGSLYVGEEGNGTLTVADGGTVVVNGGLCASLTDLYGNGTIKANGGVLDADLVFDANHGLQQAIAFGTNGTINFNLVAGNGLGVGYKNQGTLRIADGMVVSSSGGTLGYRFGALGTATIIGEGSKWLIGGTLNIGPFGSGILNVDSGGEVSNAEGWLDGNGGPTSVANITGAGSKWTNSTLYIRNGTLHINAGGQVASTECFLGYYGYIGTVTISGIGSKWTNSGNLSMGRIGNGYLNIIAGGQVSNVNCYVGNDSSTGTAAILVSGSGSQLTNSGALSVGDDTIGTMDIEDGGQVNNSNGYLAYHTDSIGKAIVSGAGSKWVSSNTLYVGYMGNGTMTIDLGGQVSNENGYLGYYSRASGIVVVRGTESKWACNGDLDIITGSLTVTDGGAVNVHKVLYASSNDLLGNGTISCNGGVLDANIVFDAGHGLKNELAFGTGGTLSLNQNGNYALGVGYKNNGTLRIADGVIATSSIGYLGYRYGSMGIATVIGNQSQWIVNGDIQVGVSGGGVMSIDEGGQVSNLKGYLGYSSNSSGSALITGLGSKWINNSELYVGSGGSGKLDIQSGGYVKDNYGYIGYSYNSSGRVAVNGTGSLWENSNNLYVGYSGFGLLTIETGGQVSSPYVSIGRNYDINNMGIVKVIGLGSTMKSSQVIYVGYQGTGNLSIESGGQVNANNILVGRGGIGSLTIAGTDSKLNIDHTLTIGVESQGSMTIESGGQVNSLNGYISYTNYPSGRGRVTVKGIGSKWSNGLNIAVGYQSNYKSILSILDGGTVATNSLTINYQSLLAIDVGTGSSLIIDNGNGSFSAGGKIRILTGARTAEKSAYTPIIAKWDSNYAAIQTLGGTWDISNNQMIVSGVQAGDSGTPVTIDRLDTQRVLIEDSGSGWKLGASFLAATASAPLSFTATAISDGTLDELQGTIGASDVLLGGWNLTASGYKTGDPVYLSFGDGIGGYADDNLKLWSYDGTKWSDITPDDLTYDGAYANFTTTAMGCFAVTVPEPSMGVLLGIFVSGVVMVARYRRGR